MATQKVTHRTCPLCTSLEIKPYRQVNRTYAGEKYKLHLGQCARCDFVFLLNDPHVEYDEDYIHLELIITMEDILARFKAEERLASIAKVVSPSPQRRFLDIGIGDGLLLSVAENYGYSTFGLDVNLAGVELARQKYGLRAEISLESMDEAFPNTGFDVIHMNEVIEHIAEPMPFLKWCRSHLNPCGCLTIQTGNISSLASRLKGASWGYLRPMHVSYFSTRTLSYAVQQAGFSIFRCITVDWRFTSSLRMATHLLKRYGAADCFSFLLLYLSALLPGIRRSVVVYAT